MLRKFLYILEFVFYYLLQLVRSNIQIAYVILSPKMEINAEVIEVPLLIETDIGILLFSNLVSMTPGTLVLDIPEHKKSVTVHILYTKHKEEMISEIQLMQAKIKRFAK